MNNLTPQSMRSPVTPFDEHSKQPFSTQRTWTPITPQPEPATMEPSARGLGIFDCPMAHQQSSVQEMPPSPHDSDSWSQSSMVDQETYFHNTQRPNISTADYDPFSSYNSGNNPGVLSAPPEEAPALVFCQTPPSTSMPSHRSSVSSSCSPPHQRAEYYTPRVKTEEPNEWNEQYLPRSLTAHGYSPFSNEVSSITGPPEDLYRSHDWPKSTSTAYPMEYNPMMGDGTRPRFDAAPMLPSANRIKKKRQRTTPEEATHKCNQCDKLFKRSYNYKSHMETHNPQRKYPHPCTAMNGNQQCTKKFQRKTDLDRHYDSVHLKARNHRCSLCGNRFARRDTLRRHTEDGCPKRFELGFRETDAPPPNAAPQRWSGPPAYGNSDRSFRLAGSMPQSYPSMGHPANAQPSHQAFFPPPEFVSSPLQHSTSDFAS